MVEKNKRKKGVKFALTFENGGFWKTKFREGRRTRKRGFEVGNEMLEKRPGQ